MASRLDFALWFFAVLVWAFLFWFHYLIKLQFKNANKEIDTLTRTVKFWRDLANTNHNTIKEIDTLTRTVKFWRDLANTNHNTIVGFGEKFRELKDTHHKATEHHIKLVEMAERKHAKSQQLVRHLEKVLSRYHIYTSKDGEHYGDDKP